MRQAINWGAGSAGVEKRGEVESDDLAPLFVCRNVSDSETIKNWMLRNGRASAEEIAEQEDI